MNYVIRRIPDGAYVAREFLPGSYTRKLERARLFPTRAAAEHDRCPDNEEIVHINELLRGA